MLGARLVDRGATAVLILLATLLSLLGRPADVQEPTLVVAAFRKWVDYGFITLAT